MIRTMVMSRDEVEKAVQQYLEREVFKPEYGKTIKLSELKEKTSSGGYNEPSGFTVTLQEVEIPPPAPTDPAVKA